MPEDQTEKPEPQISPNKPGHDPRDDIEDSESRVPRNPDKKSDPE
jgi:hypothetical protein